MKGALLLVLNGGNHYLLKFFPFISQEARDAVQEALAFRGQGKGSLFFYNPVTSTSDWITSRETLLTMGKQRFAK